ncbi:MAG TPA: copper chaperone PCu(A)C [Acidiferrobacterales bacterium]|nr:copper chaperone PCu(A)C [Acidiferrobacterales bacterium]
MNRSIASLAGFVVMLTGVPALWAAGAADHIHVVDPYVRVSPPGVDRTSAYLILHNTGKTDHALVKAASPAARVTELHTVMNEGGVMKMRPVEKIALKAGGETRLQPGGLHIMLIGLKQPLTEGGKVALTLSFDDGSQKSVQAPVKPVMPGMDMKMDHHH